MGHTLQDIIKSEKEYLQERRNYLTQSGLSPELGGGLFGIASSGGGVRSAAVNLGFLKVLTEHGILQKADYHSTVSGGGYAGAYVQGTVRQMGTYNDLFTEDKEKHLRASAANYMSPNGLIDRCHKYLAYASYLILSIVRWMVLLLIIFCIVQVIGLLFRQSGFDALLINTGRAVFKYFMLFLFIVFLLQLLAITLLKQPTKTLLNVMLGLAAIFTGWLFVIFISMGYLDLPLSLRHYAIGIITAIFFWKLFQVELLSFGLYYEKKLSDSFLAFAPYCKSRKVPLADFVVREEDEKVGFFSKLAQNAENPFSKTPPKLPHQNHYLAPYPLINTCINLSESDDYFLISPKFIGSYITGYLQPSDKFYRDINLPTAIRISAAAVNAGMGTFTTPLRSFFITLFNASLGEWVRNPNASDIKYEWSPGITRFLRDLTSKRDINSGFVSISDGGHIENLGVFELLRRKCSLIICIDAGYDPDYAFEDLKNLTQRSMTELGMEIVFREGNDPVKFIRPGLKGYSENSFAIADINERWDYANPTSGHEQYDPKKANKADSDASKTSTKFIYIKSCLTMQYLLENRTKVNERKFKQYKFPHTPTADQSFEPNLWDSYYELGQFLAKDMLDKTMLLQSIDKKDK